MTALALSCVNKNPQMASEDTSSSLEGTWQLLTVETIQGGDTTIDDYTVGIKGIKMFNDSHFSFFQHDLTHGKDSLAVYVSGGGTYTLMDGMYTENLEYCNFRGSICRGRHLNSAYIIETYVRLIE
jgi:hypothetical protein